MTLARAIIKVTDHGALLLAKPARTVAEIELAVSIAHVCRAASTLLQPDPAGRIAESMLIPRQQTRAWLAGEETRTTHGKNGIEALPVVPNHAAQLMDATMAAMALPKRGGTS